MKKENISNKKNKSIIIATVSMIVFLLILKDIFQYEITSYDSWAYNVFVENFRSEEMTLIMKTITACGGIVIIGIICLLLFLFMKNKKIPMVLMINTIVIVMLNDFIKFVVQRPRPTGYNLITESNYSFPSGHSMVSTFFYGFLIYLIYMFVKNKKLKVLLISLLSFLIILICISRIYLGVHYLSDTIAGFALSLAYIMILVMFNHEIERKN